MNELLTEVSQVHIIPKQEQLFELYQTYLSLENVSHEDFETFIQWAPRALADYSTIDGYLLDGDAVFRDLRSIKEIEEWSFAQDELSAAQKAFIARWDLLGDLYNAWKQKAKDQKTAVGGQISRLAAEKFLEDPAQLEFSKIYFTAINALTKAEEKLVYHLVRSGRGEILWDADTYYVDDKKQEAGLFLRKHQDELGPLEGLSDRIRKSPPDVQITQCSTNIGQVKAAAHLLSKIENPGPETAIVMADESLLTPLINSLPAELKFNVTLGLTLRGSSILDLWMVLAKVSENPSESIYFRDLQTILFNPLIRAIRDKEQKEWHDLLRDLEKHNITYVAPIRLKRIGSVGALIAQTAMPSDHDQFGSNFLDFTEEILSHLEESLARSQVIVAAKIVRNAIDVCTRKDIVVSIPAFIKLTEPELISASVSFISEPVQGVQVMGVLESRALDFKHVILVGANEGALPAAQRFDSYIPFDVRHQLGLPGGEEQDAIYAYYFYRLFHQAAKIEIITTSEQPRLGTTEPSRFVSQIIHEFREKPTVNQWHMALPEVIDQQFSIPNSPEIRAAIQQRMEHRISPSALNTFIMCPLDFYFKYALGLYEPGKVEESIEHSGFGTIVHNVLENYYKPLKGKVLTIAMVQSWTPSIAEKTEEVMIDMMPESAFTTGENYLAYEASKNYVKQFLKAECEWLEEARKSGKEVRIIDIEKELESEIEIQGVKIKLRGFADRIDRVGDTLRIIDYKTGKVEASNLKYSGVPESICTSGKIKLLQILMYGYCALKHYEGEMEMGMISMRNLTAGFIPAQDKNSSLNRENVEEIFPQALEHLFNTMMAEDFVWTHEKDANFCVYCSGQGFEPKRKF